MGAYWDITIEKGNTSREAYDRAYSEAKSMYGSDSYNGTISTFSGFEEVPTPRGENKKDLITLLNNSEEMEKRFPALGEKWEKCGCMKIDADTYAFWGWYAT